MAQEKPVERFENPRLTDDGQTLVVTLKFKYGPDMDICFLYSSLPSEITAIQPGVARRALRALEQVDQKIAAVHPALAAAKAALEEAGS